MAFSPRGSHHSELELFAKKVGIVTAVVIVAAVLWRAREVLILVFIAAVLAAGIQPAVHRVRVLGRYWLHRNVPRGTAVLVVYFPFVFLLAALAVFLVPRLIVETRDLSTQMPALIDANILMPLQRWVPMEAVRSYIRGGVSLPRASLFLYARHTATVLASFVAVLFMVVYMLIDAHRLRNMILLIYPAEVRGDRRATLNRMAQRMSSWLGAQLLLSAIMGAAVFVALLLLRVPYALPLAILAMVGELVPVIGPIIGMSPALAIAILHSRWQFWWLLVFVLVMQKLENLLIAPRVMARKVSISPLAAFIAFMLGGAILGIAGAIMAIPIAAIAQVAFEEAFVLRRERRFNVERAGTLFRRVD